MAEELTLAEAGLRFEQLLFDTCVLIDELKRPTGRLGYVNRQQHATSVVAVWEFLHGAKGVLLSAHERHDRRAWLRDQEIVTLSLSPSGSASFDALLETEGPPSIPDALLAAECLGLGIAIVTSNVRDFVTIEGLHYVPW